MLAWRWPTPYQVWRFWRSILAPMSSRAPLRGTVAVATILAVCVLGQHTLRPPAQAASDQRQGQHVLVATGASVSITVPGRIGKESDDGPSATNATVAHAAGSSNADASALRTAPRQRNLRLDLPPLTPRPPPVVSAAC